MRVPDLGRPSCAQVRALWIVLGPRVVSRCGPHFVVCLAPLVQDDRCGEVRPAARGSECWPPPPTASVCLCGSSAWRSEASLSSCRRRVHIRQIVVIESADGRLGGLMARVPCLAMGVTGRCCLHAASSASLYSCVCLDGCHAATQSTLSDDRRAPSRRGSHHEAGGRAELVRPVHQAQLHVRAGPRRAAACARAADQRRGRGCPRDATRGLS